MSKRVHCSAAIRVIEFFRIRLLTLSNEEVVEWIDQLEKESKAIKKSLIKLCWYMRGGMSLEEAWATSYHDRQLINEMINENLDVAKETGLPFF